METSITREFGLSTPIISAGMAFVAGPPLASAVSNAGGLGMLGGAPNLSGINAYGTNYRYRIREDFGSS